MNLTVSSLTVLCFATFLGSCSARNPRNAGQEPKDTQTNAVNQPQLQTDTNSVTVWTRQQAAQGPEKFRLVVSLISIGEGTDPEAAGALTDALAAFRSKTGKSPAYILIPWGREGEVDYCFIMNELTPSEQTDFITFLRGKLSSRSLIQIQENGRNRFR